MRTLSTNHPDRYPIRVIPHRLWLAKIAALTCGRLPLADLALGELSGQLQLAGGNPGRGVWRCSARGGLARLSSGRQLPELIAAPGSIEGAAAS